MNQYPDGDGGKRDTGREWRQTTRVHPCAHTDSLSFLFLSHFAFYLAFCSWSRWGKTPQPTADSWRRQSTVDGDGDGDGNMSNVDMSEWQILRGTVSISWSVSVRVDRLLDEHMCVSVLVARSKRVHRHPRHGFVPLNWDPSDSSMRKRKARKEKKRNKDRCLIRG